ncbi:MAG: hypothetical protein SVM80_12200, partial [Halobacteriota archaeon]|nr:hypothetical protein [Halobacteriota archaeon]
NRGWLLKWEGGYDQESAEILRIYGCRMGVLIFGWERWASSIPISASLTGIVVRRATPDFITLIRFMISLLIEYSSSQTLMMVVAISNAIKRINRFGLE